MTEYFPKKILLATDGSKDAELAATSAVGLARMTGSELHIVNVGAHHHEPPPFLLRSFGSPIPRR